MLSQLPGLRVGFGLGGNDSVLALIYRTCAPLSLIPQLCQSVTGAGDDLCFLCTGDAKGVAHRNRAWQGRTVDALAMTVCEMLNRGLAVGISFSRGNETLNHQRLGTNQVE